MIGTGHKISERVMHHLKNEEKILSKITPKYILEKAFAKEENEKRLCEVYELFLKTPGMPVLENKNVLYEAIKDGVRNGSIGVKEDTEVYYKQDVS